MKKIVVILFFVALLSPIYSLEVDMDREFLKEETLIARLSGNFLEPILEENIEFYRRHIRVPVDYELFRIDEDYYLYAILPQRAGNHSILIEEASYRQGSSVEDNPIQINFTIINETVPYNINPGVIFTQEDFSIEAQNLENQEISLNVDMRNFEGLNAENSSGSAFSIRSGDTEEIYFDIESVTETSLNSVVFSSQGFSYSVPAYISVNETKSIRPGISSLSFTPSELSVDISTNSSTRRILTLENDGDTDISNLNLTVSNSLKNFLNLSANHLEELEKDSSLKLDLYFDTPETNPGELEGFISAKNSSIEEVAFIYMNISESFIPDENETEFETCSEIGGVVCGPDSRCSGTEENLNGIPCCTEGLCEEVENGQDNGGSTGTGEIIGWSLLALVIVIAAWIFFKKYKGAKNEVDFGKFMKKKK